MNLSQEAFAELCGLSPGGLKKIENGQNEPRVETLNQVAKALNLSVSELMAQDMPDRKPPEPPTAHPFMDPIKDLKEYIHYEASSIKNDVATLRAKIDEQEKRLNLKTKDFDLIKPIGDEVHDEILEMDPNVALGILHKLIDKLPRQIIPEMLSLFNIIGIGLGLDNIAKNYLKPPRSDLRKK